MKKFDIHAWRHKQLIESYNNKLSDQILNQLFEELIPQDALLNEGIGDFLSNLKDKIKSTKAFTSLLALSNEFKDASKAITLALKLKSLDLLPKNEAELQILKNKLEGKDINEATDSTYGKKLNSTLKNPLEWIRMWQKSFLGKSATAIFAFFMIVSVVGSDIKDSAEAAGIDLGNTTTQVGVTPSGTDMAGIANALTLDGFDQEEIEDVLKGRGDVKLTGKYSLGGDIKIFTDDGTGKSTVEIPDDIEDEGELSSETDNINQAADQGLKLNISGEQTANFSLFDYGSSDITQEGKTEANTENQKIIDYLINGQDYSETIIGQSSNTGPNSNYDNSTNEADKLDANRANALADYSLDDIKKGLDDKGVKYTSTDTTITLEDGTKYTQNVETGQNPESLNQIDKTDDTPTQSAIRVGEVETTDPPTNVVLVDFDPVAAPGSTGGGGTFVPPPPESFGNLIREGQITVIMALIKPEVEIFPYLNAIRHDKNSNEAIGGYEQSDWLQVRDNDSMPEESRTLAGAIINARKSPDTLTSRIAKCLGIELSKRALAKATPGPAGVGMELVGFEVIRERIHPLYELLGEAVIDQFIDCNNVNKNAGQLLAYIGSMYASKDNTQIGIVNTSNLPSNLKSQLDKVGFSQTSMGRDKGIYVFMGKGIPDNISKPISLDPNIQVAKDKGAIPSSKLDIDSKSFKDGKIFISPKNVSVFPKEFYEEPFYKDAVKDGWVFINRKDASSIPKGTKVKVFPIQQFRTKTKYNPNYLEH